MIVCLATRIFAGGRGWGPHTSGRGGNGRSGIRRRTTGTHSAAGSVACHSIPMCRFPIFCSLHQRFECAAAFEQRTFERGLERLFGDGRQAGLSQPHLANVEPMAQACRFSKPVSRTSARQNSQPGVRSRRPRDLRHSRPRGDDNTFGRVRPHGGGGCGNGEQSDSHEPGNRSMSRHEDLLLILLWSDRPLVWVTGTSLRFNSDATRFDCANPQTDTEWLVSFSAAFNL